MPPLEVIEDIEESEKVCACGTKLFRAVSKYADALPLYRQEKIFERIGVDIGRSAMVGWMVMVPQGSKPIMDLPYERLHSSPLINVDETPVQILKEPGRENTTKSYKWAFRGGSPEKPVILYRYSPQDPVKFHGRSYRAAEGVAKPMPSRDMKASIRQ